nr:DUF2254 domain-containing protein [uncultured Desulfobulbus sp.]
MLKGKDKIFNAATAGINGGKQMQWNRWYCLKSYIRASLWFVPFVSMLLYWVASRITHGIGGWMLRTGRIDETTAFLALSMSGARTTLETIVTINLSFLVFTFGSLLVAIQVAGGQYTPRIIATTLLRDNAIRFTVGYFVFTMLFALRALTKMGSETVHQFNTFIAAAFGLISIVVFLYLIDYAARFLRPVSIVHRVGMFGLAVIQTIYPESTKGPQAINPSCPTAPPHRSIAHKGTSGIVLAVNLDGLVTQAQRAGGVIEFVPQVGDFVSVDEPLFHLHGGANTIDDHHLQAAVAFGTERTLEHDPAFAFRILVDIAIKALSPAINDPTTAVLAIDQLHRLLRRVGLRHVSREELRDPAGELRLIFRTPNWEDFVHLSCTEIRHYGAGSIQVMRRMRSMLENLMYTLPPHRHAELQRQLEFLDRTIDGQYAFAEDRMLARIADSQGLGGSVGMQAVTDAPAV